MDKISSVVDSSKEEEVVVVVVSKKEYEGLRKRDFKLTCLEAGGIDNWEMYSESLEDYRKLYEEEED